MTSVVALVVALVLGAGAGSAYAFFTNHASGTGVVKAGTAQSITVVSARGTVSSELFPGGTADLLVEFDNPNPKAVVVTSVSENGPVTVLGGHGCTGQNSGVSLASEQDLSIPVASGRHVLIHIANGASMSIASASGCQGASFRIPVTVTVQP